jgi:beta-phosphoglucomutase-like phosphatase (HAD superfamily)
LGRFCLRRLGWKFFLLAIPFSRRDSIQPRVARRISDFPHGSHGRVGIRPQRNGSQLRMRRNPGTSILDGEMTATVRSPLPADAPPRRRRRAVRASSRGADPPTPPARELDTIATRWQLALDTAGRALDADASVLPASETAVRRRELTAERRESSSLLRGLARARGIEPLPWLPQFTVTASMLGLEQPVQGCVFDLDGVLTDSGLLHAAAWADVFDAYLLRLAHRTGRHFIPFDREADYRNYLDGRLRIEGVHAFLESRGIHIPEGRPDDDAGAESAYGFARHKGELVERRLGQRSLAALAGARRYLQAAGYARLGRAVVSASASTLPMLELVGLEQLVDVQLDAGVMRLEQLRARPAPDLLLAACRRLGIRPDEAVALTSSGAGIVAARSAGLRPIGIGVRAQAELLRDFGAERVAPALSALLDPRLTGSS